MPSHLPFGGINLEDIKAPECFEIEDRIKAALDIPVMHDDQHGTAIITFGRTISMRWRSMAKDIEDIKIVVQRRGCLGYFLYTAVFMLGVKKENVIMFDTRVSSMPTGLT